MREILISFLLLFSFSLSVQAQSVTTSPDWDAQQIEVGHDSVNVSAQPHLPERLFNVTGESTQPISYEASVDFEFNGETQASFEVGW